MMSCSPQRNNNTKNTTTTTKNNIFVAAGQTRLVTIAAHVDHGKTTLADNLIEANGLISERLAGTLRYLDSDPEEQRRGITMRSSAIGLQHAYTEHAKGNKNKKTKQQQQSQQQQSQQPQPTNMIIHLLDSPGHTDFSMEVSSALLACDSCLLVLDAVEGMAPRTHQVLREAYRHRLVPILVMNKIDRLCTDLRLTPTEAYVRLRNLLETVNAAASAMLTSAASQQQQQRVDNKQHLDADAPTTTTTTTTTSSLPDRQKINKNHKNNDAVTTQKQEQQQQQQQQDYYTNNQEVYWTFEPAKNNVVFCSALFGWGFTVQSLARSLFRQGIVPIKPALLKQCLFADCKFGLPDYKILKWKQHQQHSSSSSSIAAATATATTAESSSSSTTTAQQPLFAEYALQPLWTIYEAVETAAAAAAAAVTTAAQTTTSGTTSSGSSAANFTGTVKIKAETAGMEQVLQALQTGATGTSSSSSNRSSSSSSSSGSSRSVPTTTTEMQHILTKTGASSVEAVLRALLRRYRPLAECLLDVICEYCPSPEQAASTVRSEVLALQQPLTVQDDNTTNSEDNETTSSSSFTALQTAVRSCDCSIDAPVVAHVCKFMSTDRSHIRDPGLPTDQNTAAAATASTGNSESATSSSSSSSSNLILGLARVLSGRLRTGDTYYLFGPKHSKGAATVQRQIRLYLLMGSSFVLVDEVPAGHLCAIYNLEDIPFKTVTLCNNPHGMPLTGFVRSKLRPLVKVNVEPENAADTDALERGLVKLSLADAAVEVTATAKGERILACLGELHLEQSILDLEKVYCGKEIKLRISDPIVDFGETTNWFERETEDFVAFFDDKTSPPLRQMTIPPYNEEEGILHARQGRARAILSGRGAAISLRVVPLYPLVYKSLQEGTVVEDGEKDVIQLGRALGFYENNGDVYTPKGILDRIKDLMCSLDSNGNALIESPGLRSGASAKGIVSANGEICVVKKAGGSDDNGEDIDKEFSGSAEYHALLTSIRNSPLVDIPNEDGNQSSLKIDNACHQIWARDMKGSAVAGFQMAVRAGWICEEPIRNVLVVLEGIEIALSYSDAEKYVPSKPLSGGMVVSSLRTGIRSALLSRPARLVERHLRLTLHSSLAGMGALYSVLSKRRGKVIDDSMVDGTDLLLITALIPQAESFGLAPELLRKTSGEVTAPELIFSHWEMLDVDPFWIPTSLEEREDFGEILQSGDASTGIDNTALRYIRQVRERKGLLVDSSRTVVAAEKQRTLKR